MTARFWIWRNGAWSKLSLRPGQAVGMGDFRNTEEGWLREWEHYEFDGRTVTRTWHTEARDCDGRHESGGEDTCDLSALRSVDAYAEYMDIAENVGIMAPNWERGERSQRDEYAELAGY